MWMGYVERFTSRIELIIAGLVGALVAVPFQEELGTLKGKLIFIATGIACSYFTSPLAVSIYNIDPALAGCVGFLLGAFGGAIMASAMRALRTLDLIDLFFGRDDKPGGDQ